MVHIAAAMICKNEKKRILVTLESVKKYVQSIIVYDTGSDDGTQDIIKSFCNTNKITLHFKQGDAVPPEDFDFSVARNILLDFADTFLDVEYLLLMDVNDELKGGDKLIQFAKKMLPEKYSSFLTNQQWFSGGYDTYYNPRFIKPRNNWRYTGAVHEYLNNTKAEKLENGHHDTDIFIYRMAKDCGIVLYQDRTQDDDKSGKRFHRDKVILLREVKKDPTNSRNIFYLAQTFSCLNEIEDSFYYYKLRSTIDNGFWEEKVISLFTAGRLSEKLGHAWQDSLSYYMRAIEMQPRVEPFIDIANHYNKTKNFNLFYIFIHAACELKFPEECILFVDLRAYEYTRFHLLGIAGGLTGHFKEGKWGVENAIKCGFKIDADANNLKLYQEQEKKTKAQENENRTIANEISITSAMKHIQLIDKDKEQTKADFFKEIIPKLAEKFTKMNSTQINKLALNLWKKKQKK